MTWFFSDDNLNYISLFVSFTALHTGFPSTRMTSDVAVKKSKVEYNKAVARMIAEAIEARDPEKAFDLVSKPKSQNLIAKSQSPFEAPPGADTH